MTNTPAEALGFESTEKTRARSATLAQMPARQSACSSNRTESTLALGSRAALARLHFAHEAEQASHMQAGFLGDDVWPRATAGRFEALAQLAIVWSDLGKQRVRILPEKNNPAA